VRTVGLDPVTGDIQRSAGQVALVAGAAAVRVRLVLELSLWLGEYGLDTAQGVPYRQLLGRKGARAAFTRTLRRVAATCPGVASLDAFRVDVDSRRNATVTLAARTATGEPVTLDAYSLGVV
jgi:hypothetical protein